MATQGSLIRAIDYNNVQSVIANILGTGSISFGYGQTVRSSPIPPPDPNTGYKTIEATDWANLKIDMLKIANHQGTAGNPLITAIPNVVRDTLIDDVQITAFEKAVDLLRDNRFELAEFSDESFNISQTRTAAWGSPAKPTVRHAFTVDFGSAANARYFFNSGGSIRFSGSRTGGTSTSQNVAWTNLLSQMGTVIYKHNGATAPSGTGFPIGFYNLTNVAQTVFTKTGSGAYTPAYAANDYTIQMSCDVSSNTNGTARYLYVVVYFNDDHANTFSDSVSGTLTHTVSYRRASGSNVNVVAPTANNTVLLSA